MDCPEKYGHKRNPIPLPGGVAPVLAFSISLILFFPLEGKFLGVLLGGVLLGGVSFWDDRRHLPAIFRLLIHLLCAWIVVFSGAYIEYVTHPFFDTPLALSEFFWMLPWGVTILWIVGFANVLNWLDGVPGLSAMSTIISGIFLGILSLTPEVNQPQVALLCFSFSACIAGFVWWNLPVPKMLLGDTGAMVFGFMLAVISVFSGGKTATVFLVLAIPLLDAGYVVIRRILSGRSPLSGKDALHLHDRLQKAGVSQRNIILLFISVSTLLGWMSLQLQTWGKILLVGGVFLCFLLFSFLLDWKIRTMYRDL